MTASPLLTTLLLNFAAAPATPSLPDSALVAEFLTQLDTAYFYQSPDIPKGCLTWKATPEGKWLRMTAVMGKAPNCAALQIQEAWLVPRAAGEPMLVSGSNRQRTPLSRLAASTVVNADAWPTDPYQSFLDGDAIDDILSGKSRAAPSKRKRVITAGKSRQAGAYLAQSLLENESTVACAPKPAVDASVKLQRLRLDSSGLTIEGHHVSSMFPNPKDGLEDFPDSSWSGQWLQPVLDAFEAPPEPRKVDVSTHRTAPFIYLRPVLQSLAYVGVSAVNLACDGFLPVTVELFNDSAAIAEKRRHSTNADNRDMVIRYTADSILIYSGLASLRPRQEAAFKTDSSYFKLSAADIQFLHQSLVDLQSRYPNLHWLGVLPPRPSRLEKLMQILQAIASPTAAGKADPSNRLEISLYGIWGRGQSTVNAGDHL